MAIVGGSRSYLSSSTGLPSPDDNRFKKDSALKNDNNSPVAMRMPFSEPLLPLRRRQSPVLKKETS